MKRLFVLLFTFAITQSAAAEVIYCRFVDSDHPDSLATWKTKSRTLKTTIGADRKQTLYSDVRVFTGLKPYKKKGISLVVFGDVPALHLKETNNARLAGDWDNVYVWEARWGEVPGRLHSNWFERTFLNEKYGPQGVCWSKQHPPRYQPRQHGDGGGGDHDRDHGKPHCDKDRNGRDRNEPGSNR